jgi:ABC-type multidrug transport system ATPase subunit
MDFVAGQSYAVTGHNGSGKSTLLKILAGNLPASEGRLRFERAGRDLPDDDFFRHLAYVAPYLELIEELTLAEAIAFQQRFKPLRVSARELVDRLGFGKVAARPLKQFSSGMKQKVKLGLALYADCPVLMLDEPTANFDQANTDWYLAEVRQAPHELVIICSNQPHEYAHCGQVLDISALKSPPG